MRNLKFISVAVLLITLIGLSAFTDNTPKKMMTNFLQQLLEKLDHYNEVLPEDRVYVHFDKPMYKPGETIWFSAYIRNGKDYKPSEQSDIVRVDLINPKGGIEKSLNLIAKEGVAVGDFEIGEEALGGMYSVKAWSEWQNNDIQPAHFVKEIQVQQIVLPRLKMKLDFQKEAYGNKDMVKADLSLNTNSNQPLANQTFSYVANLNGQKLVTATSTTDQSGNAVLSFELPDQLKTNDGLLNVMIDYQGMAESISRSIPIILNKIELAFFPEGGDLVEGLTSNVAFKALNEFNKPADIEGVVINDLGIEVKNFSSFHHGMGAFELTPQKGQTYKVRISKPAGITQLFDLPEALRKGYGVEVSNQTTDNLVLTLKATQQEELAVVVNVRGENYFSKTIDCKGFDTKVNVPLKDLPIGVAQISLFDSKGIPRAERLTFVNKDRQLKVNIKTDKERYLPREKVKMTIETSDERGIPMPANLSVAVADDQLLAFADNKSSNILSWLLMESDIKEEIHEPNFYFDEKEPKATAALDYLLMTAGWRRYTWKEIDAGKPVANIQGERAEINGLVVDKDDQPIKNAEVTIEGTNVKQMTDSNGNFALQNIELYETKRLIIKDPSGKVISRRWINKFEPNLEIKDVPAKGIVIAEDGEPLFGANVQIVGTQSGVVTDMDGVFEFEQDLIGEETELVVSYVGYRSKSIDVRQAKKDKNGLIKVEMDESNQMLMEVVAMAEERRPARLGKAARQRDNRVDFNAQALDVPMEEPQEVFAPEEMIPADVKEAPKPMAAKPVIALDKNVKNEKAKIAQNVAASEVEDQLFLDEEEIAFGWRFEVDMIIIDDMEDNKKGPSEPIIVYYRAKEFAMPKYELPKQPQVRSDFRSTLYWNGNVTIGRNGKTVLEFYNSDAVSSFNITAEGIATDGSIGRQEKKFFTQLPFSISSKIPVEVVTGDKLSLPVTFVNNTARSLSGNLKFELPEGLKLEGKLPANILLDANSSTTKFLNFLVTQQVEKAKFAVQFNSSGFSDAIEQEITMVNKGYPASFSFSGTKLDETFSVNIAEPLKGTMEGKLTAYASTINQLMSGLESMLREPHGCFEQTSSSTYPNILVLKYMEETDQVKPEVAKRAMDLIKRGYSKLTSFESASGGFEWFGGDPGHEGLTAYGLMEFVDMKSVYDGVDDKMIKRTTEWLLKRKDGKGEFQRNPRALHEFGLADNATLSAYITWALTEANIKGLEKEAEAAYQTALKTKNPYQLGLAANIMLNYKDSKRAAKALEELLSIQLENGSWNQQDKDKSGPGSGGQGLRVETAALALSALLKQDNPHYASVKTVAEFILSSRNGHGGFGNTNSTVLALRSLIEYAKFSKQTNEDGTLELYVDGKKVSSRNYKKGVQEPIVLDDITPHLKAGKHKIQVKYKGAKTAMPYSAVITWRTALPNTSADCPIALSTKLGGKTAKVGETVRLTTELVNTTTDGQPMTLAIVGIPAGLTAQPWQLKELLDKKTVDFYETKGNRVVFYYRQMAPSEKKTIHLDLKAEVPGTFDAPASTAYLYYTAENKYWTSVDQITVRQ